MRRLKADEEGLFLVDDKVVAQHKSHQQIFDEKYG